MPSALLALKKILFNLSWPIIALIALVGLASWSGGDFAASLHSTTAVRSYLGAENETPGTLSRLEAAQIRYSQSTYSILGETDEGEIYMVAENIQWLKDHPDQELPWG